MSKQDKALKLARGSYQRALILGSETWSGSSLKGKARKYGRHYANSRRALLQRLDDEDLAWIEVSKAGRLTLRFGRPPAYYLKTSCAAGVAWKKGEPTVLDKMVEDEPA